jgi:hypothetical protein
MARPQKNNADYFTHDADMRNDARVKAIRKKFGLPGFAVYVMIVEYLTDSDFFQFKNDNLTIELIAGDFDCETELLQKVIDHCIYLDLLQLTENGFIRCKTLENRMQILLSKRKRDRNYIIADDNTQSKVKESKVKESIIDVTKTFVVVDDFYADKPKAFDALKVDDTYIEECQRLLSGKGWVTDPIDIVALLQNFINGKCNINDTKTNIRQHFKNWLFREKIENLTTLATVFKNGIARKTA